MNVDPELLEQVRRVYAEPAATTWATGYNVWLHGYPAQMWELGEREVVLIALEQGAW